MNVLIVVRNQEAAAEVRRHMTPSVKVAAPGDSLPSQQFDLVLVTARMRTPAEIEWFDTRVGTRLGMNADMYPAWGDE